MLNKSGRDEKSKKKTKAWTMKKIKKNYSQIKTWSWNWDKKN